MKKYIKMAALVAAVLVCLSVFAACGRVSSGRYTSETGMLTYEFSGNKISGPITGDEPGTYRIDQDSIIITFTDKNGNKATETLTFAKGDGYVVIDGITLYKEKTGK